MNNFPALLPHVGTKPKTATGFFICYVFTKSNPVSHVCLGKVISKNFRDSEEHYSNLFFLSCVPLSAEKKGKKINHWVQPGRRVKPMYCVQLRFWAILILQNHKAFPVRKWVSHSWVPVDTSFLTTEMRSFRRPASRWSCSELTCNFSGI